MTALLCIAEGLDRSHNGVITYAKLRAVGQTTMRLEVEVTASYQWEVWGMEDHLKALENVIKREVNLKLKNTTAATMPPSMPAAAS